MSTAWQPMPTSRLSPRRLPRPALKTDSLQGCWGTRGTLTAPVLLLSALQSGMIFESWTIQLLILSLRLRSTAARTVGTRLCPACSLCAQASHLPRQMPREPRPPRHSQARPRPHGQQVQGPDLNPGSRLQPAPHGSSIGTEKFKRHSQVPHVPSGQHRQLRGCGVCSVGWPSRF